MTYSLEEILLKKWSTKEEKVEMKKIRSHLMNFAQESGIEKLSEKLEKLVYRPVSEVYIPLPDSKSFTMFDQTFWSQCWDI